MTRVPLDADEPFDAGAESPEDGDRKERRRKTTASSLDVDIEREVTKRHLIEAITSIVAIVLYMAFTLIREREPGVVVLDDEGDPEDDWDEGA